MKILKLKSILFSLMAIVLVTVFLSSCDKYEQSENTTVEEISQSSINNYSDMAFKLPKDYDQLSEENVNEYISNLTNQEIEQLIENHRIVKFLISINLWEEVDAILSKGDILSIENVSKYLTKEQFEELKNFSIDNQVDLRWCSGCVYYNQTCPPDGCIGVNGIEYTYKNYYKRHCDSGYSYTCKVTCTNSYIGI